MPPSSADRRHELQRVLDVAERLLHAERDQHDAGHHREVQVGVRVARDLVLLAPLRPRKSRRSATSATTSKYSHHSAAATAIPARAAATTPASTPVLGADADRHDRLAERDDHDQARALGEVAGHELPALAPKRYGPPMSSASASAQSAPCSSPSVPRRRAAARRRAPCRSRGRRPSCAARGSSRLARSEQRDLPDPHDRVGAPRTGAPRRRTPRARRARRRAARPWPRRSTRRTAPSSGSTTLVSHA